MKIIDKCEESVSDVNAFLRSKNCPEYAEIYKEHGETYGVQWVLAVCQSCLETGFWTFRGDVRPSQNNFAGIGAIGNGKSGDKYASPNEGIHAQMQCLALRAGVDIPLGMIISTHVRNNYEYIRNLNTTTWEQLSNSYATDGKYFEKILSIFNEYLMFKRTKKTKANWFKIYRENETLVMVAFCDDVAIQRKVVETVSDVFEFSKVHGAEKSNIHFANDNEKAPIISDKNDNLKLQEWIPFARRIDIGMKNRGFYRNKHPEGMIVHFTAGRGNVDDMLKYCAQQGYTLIGIGKDGEIVQPIPLSVWGYHCGTSDAENKIGVEIVNAGRLNKKADGTFWSWFGTQIPAENVRYVEYPETSEQISGYYEKYTEAQEKALIKLCLWLVENGNGVFKIENIIGHDEACTRAGKKGNKNDPSGALSMSMPQFRSYLSRILIS